jgi:hypothetical protein
MGYARPSELSQGESWRRVPSEEVVAHEEEEKLGADVVLAES